MTEVIDSRAKNRWTKSDISYHNYQSYIKNKSDIYNLTIIDLFYISNFKGGNASIHEDEIKVNKKLNFYSNILKEIDNSFRVKELKDLTEAECNKLIIMLEKACGLTNNNTLTKIDGFGPSYLSALLNAYFPNLIPILDRRMLINLKLVKKQNVRSGQIVNIEDFYASLIKKFAELSKKSPNESFRDIDRNYFSRKLDIESLEL